MNHKVILIVLDGLNYQVARNCMGYLNALIEGSQATLYRITSALPSLSRPLYECILSGKIPIKSGILDNNVVRLSRHSSIFSLAKNAGLTTAAAAYHWLSELYNRAPYNKLTDRYCDSPRANIQHAIFYHLDDYPDEILFVDAAYLINKHTPDFLLIHPMNIDDMGHKFGLQSSQYRNTARKVDRILSHHLDQWRSMGYQILITSDHGMNDDCSHGGILNEERQVPMFVIGEAFSHQKTQLKQDEICGCICQILGIPEHQKKYNPNFLVKEVSHE